MIIHKLVRRIVQHGDDYGFYIIQVQDSISWLRRKGITLNAATEVLDLGCGNGFFGQELLRNGCQVTFADIVDSLEPQIKGGTFKKVNLDIDDLGTVGLYDVVICSNVLEHLAHPNRLINAIPNFLKKHGNFYLSWTNWLSPWGGHEFSPFHYIGPRRGHLLFDRFAATKRKHTPYVNLFPTSISQVLELIHKEACLRLRASATRYYPEFSFVLRLPVVREFLALNCALLLTRTDHMYSNNE